MFIRRFAVLILCVAFVLSACGESSKDSAKETRTRRLVYGLTLLPSGFDPHINASFELGIPFRSVYDTLVYRHPQTLAFEPGLAESWEISEDRLRYTFHLKENVKFHDDTPFDASAVGVNIDRVLMNSGKAKALLGPNFEGYSIIDESTIELRLTAPYEPLLDALSQVFLGIASPLALANYTDGTYQYHQVGTGPYQLIETVPGERIVLQRNPDYAWGPAFYTVDNPAPVEEIEFRFFTDPVTRADSLQNKSADIMGELPPINVELLLGNNDLRIYPVPIAGQPLQFIFNVNRFPTNDPNIRKALLFATNRTAIIDAVFSGQSPVAHGPLASPSVGYTPTVEEMYPYSAAQSAELFGLAQVSDSNNDGILDQAGVPLELKIIVPPWGFIPETAQAIAGQWRALGITVEIEQVPTLGALYERVEQGDFNLVSHYDFGLDASVLNGYFMTDASNNLGGYSNQELDALLTQALVEGDANTRDSLYAAAQERIMGDALILPIREYINHNGATADLEGVIFDAHGWWPLLPNFQWRQTDN